MIVDPGHFPIIKISHSAIDEGILPANPHSSPEAAFAVVASKGKGPLLNWVPQA